MIIEEEELPFLHRLFYHQQTKTSWWNHNYQERFQTLSLYQNLYSDPQSATCLLQKNRQFLQTCHKGSIYHHILSAVLCFADPCIFLGLIQIKIFRNNFLFAPHTLKIMNMHLMLNVLEFHTLERTWA